MFLGTALVDFLKKCAPGDGIVGHRFGMVLFFEKSDSISDTKNAEFGHPLTLT